ncbi:patatin-like phospholipase family protein [Kamptonema formosum]|uniref:patatin-like phospholipase family protein n=1 Tax=Kamptonema formosum TaxID=331992 RepID=UPI00034B0CE8|nr:patatin-like phospholipase family protein [Oscillatoria sp. PCC 10802]
MTFRILSFDGGGIRGVLSARILKEVERQIKEKTGQDLHQYFHMIAGTSTGSILTAGVAKKLHTDQIIELYKKYGASIFPSKFRVPFLTNLKEGVVPGKGYKYSHEGLENALKEQFGDTPISQIESPIILILAYDTLYRNTTFFTNCHPDLGSRWFDPIPLWKICVCSSSAPTFFPPYQLESQKEIGQWFFPHIDGGVSANNPSLAAISQALSISQSKDVPEEVKQKYKLNNVQLQDISLLSIGTGQSGNPFTYEEVKGWSVLRLVSHLVDIFMEPKGEIDSRICQLLMGGLESDRYLRLQFELNEKFAAKPGETWQDARVRLAEKDRKNKFTNKPLTEEMDKVEAIDSLIEAAEAFLDTGRTYYTRANTLSAKAIDGPPVKEAIAKFIDAN